MYTVVMMLALNTGAEAPAFCHGCSGCFGGGCHGCYSGCSRSRGGHGCFGGCFRSRGCHGCWGGCHSYRGRGCHGCYSYRGCHSNHGCHSYHGCNGCNGGYVPEKKAMPKEKEARSNGPAAATVVVTVPENAKLTIDGRATTSSSTSRRFVSPPLQRGYQYFYTIKGEVTRDGKTLTTSKRVLVTAGQETKVSLDFNEAPTTNVASR